mmetsp:Transcript_956/g.3392  ORF Transcript_956/g.3392 Transcript_956/m.3392 type:complete len:218 (-) Transcript_956:2242-2895(-)
MHTPPMNSSFCSKALTERRKCRAAKIKSTDYSPAVHQRSIRGICQAILRDAVGRVQLPQDGSEALGRHPGSVLGPHLLDHVEPAGHGVHRRVCGLQLLLASRARVDDRLLEPLHALHQRTLVHRVRPRLGEELRVGVLGCGNILRMLVQTAAERAFQALDAVLDGGPVRAALALLLPQQLAQRAVLLVPRRALALQARVQGLHPAVRFCEVPGVVVG